MARSCGLRIGPRRFELVVLDGSARKHKIAAYTSGEFPDPENIDSCADVVRDAFKTTGAPKDNVGLSIDTGLAAFRTLKLPFGDRSKIDQIIKFEVESQLPQWNIDDVIIDYHVMDSAGESSELMISAVPKADLKRVLTICEAAGVEPLEAELETSAMVNAAYQADISHVDDAQVLVHVGEESTSVVVIDGGKVREMRAIHIGAMTHAPLIEAAAALPKVDDVDEEDEATGLDILDEPSADFEDEEFEGPDPIEVQRRLEQAIKRIRRELGRTVSAARTANPIEAIYICGRELPGLVGSSILDVPVYVLDVFDEDGGQPVDGFGELVVPYGVAVGRLGGGLVKASLRREELRYSGAFERVEMPLAVLCLMLLTSLAVLNIFVWQKREEVERATDYWVRSSLNYLMGNPKQGVSGTLTYAQDLPKLKKYVGEISVEFGKDENYPGDPDRNRYEQMQYLRRLIRDENETIEKDLGSSTEVEQPMSVLHAMTLVLGELDKLAKSGARPSLRKIDAQYQPSKGKNPDSVFVDLDVTFFAENSVEATGHFEDFKNNLLQTGWAKDPNSRQSDPLDDGKGIYVDGLKMTVDLDSVLNKVAALEGGKR